MSAGRRVIKVVNFCVSLVVVLAFLLIGAYAVYALWDNHQVYQAAEDVQASLLKMKPDENSEGGPTIEELLKINPEVCAAVTMDGTTIDHPVVQGESNLDYVNKDVYGNFALAGSIFLDARNSRDFSDSYNLLYGHHMAESKMFGDLELYKDAAFFAEHTTGTLLVPGGVYDLKVFAVLVVNASDDGIFDIPEDGDLSQMWQTVREQAIHTNDSMPDEDGDPQILALGTCASDFSDARTIVLTEMHLRG